jgi:propanediol dehydratase small subunit
VELTGPDEIRPLRYPLSSSRDQVHTVTGRPVSEVTLDRVVSGEIGSDDVRVSPEVLRLQARFAEGGGNRQLGENLRRGAELVAFSDEELLEFYDKLRPGRATAAELDELAAALDARGAALCAALVRGARTAYARRGLTS